MNYLIKFLRDGDVVAEYEVEGASASTNELRLHYREHGTIFLGVRFDEIQVVRN